MLLGSPKKLLSTSHRLLRPGGPLRAGGKLAAVHPGGGDATPAFVSQWNTANTSTGSSTATQVKLPLYSGGSYNFEVNWGDGNSDTITAYNQAEATHTYSSGGTYTISITGTITGFRFNNTGDRLKILGVSQWGPLKPGNLGAQFYGAANMTASATDVLDLSGITNGANMFRLCAAFNGDLSGVDVSTVTDFGSFFYGCTVYNQPMSNWDVSAGTNTNNMFRDCAAFNQPITNWDVSGVLTAAFMFFGCSAYNQPMNWSMPSCTLFDSFLHSCTVFNQSLSTFDMSSAADIKSMVRNCPAFDQDLSAWDVTAVTTALNFLLDSGLSTANYDALLIGWEGQAVNNSVPFHGGSSTYTSGGAAAAARAALIADHSWSITDGGVA